MENTFNVRLSFKGEGDLTFTLPIVGQITIWAGRDIYLKGATQRIVEILRQYRSMQLEHKLNGDATGCYRVIEVGNIDRIPKNAYRPVAAPKMEHIAALKAEMMKANQIAQFDEEVITEAGQLEAEKLQEKEDTKQKEEDAKIGLKEEVDSTGDTTDDLEGEKVENTDENTDVDDSTQDSGDTDNTTAKLDDNVAEITVTVGNLKGKKIKDLDAKGLRKVARYAKNNTEKNAAETALKILFPSN